DFGDLLQVLRRHEATAQRIKAYGCNLDDTAAQMVADWILALPPWDMPSEIHLSNNQLTLGGVSPILKAIHSQSKTAFPRVPVWLRLENNNIDVGFLDSLFSEEGGSGLATAGAWAAPRLCALGRPRRRPAARALPPRSRGPPSRRGDCPAAWPPSRSAPPASGALRRGRTSDDGALLHARGRTRPGRAGGAALSESSRRHLGAALGCLAAFGAAAAAAAWAGAHARAWPAGAEGCEGYWPPPAVCLGLGQGGRDAAAGDASLAAWCPQRRVDAEWPGRGEFVAKLREIEAAAREADAAGGPRTAAALAACGLQEAPFVTVVRYRGLSWSRMAEGVMVGSAEFHDAHSGEGACWPDGYLEHYVGDFMVRPTDGFIEYVRAFDLDAFRKAIRAGGACAGGDGTCAGVACAEGVEAPKGSSRGSWSSWNILWDTLGNLGDSSEQLLHGPGAAALHIGERLSIHPVRLDHPRAHMGYRGAAGAGIGRQRGQGFACPASETGCCAKYCASKGKGLLFHIKYAARQRRGEARGAQQSPALSASTLFSGQLALPEPPKTTTKPRPPTPPPLSAWPQPAAPPPVPASPWPAALQPATTLKQQPAHQPASLQQQPPVLSWPMALAAVLPGASGVVLPQTATPALAQPPVLPLPRSAWPVPPVPPVLPAASPSQPSIPLLKAVPPQQAAGLPQPAAPPQSAVPPQPQQLPQVGSEQAREETFRKLRQELEDTLRPPPPRRPPDVDAGELRQAQGLTAVKRALQRCTAPPERCSAPAAEKYRTEKWSDEAAQRWLAARKRPADARDGSRLLARDSRHSPDAAARPRPRRRHSASRGRSPRRQ
ncbi:unnamed protein product, partial [Prorocentrum cordatum]